MKSFKLDRSPTSITSFVCWILALLFLWALLTGAPAHAGDWRTHERVDQMTDVRACFVTSSAAKVTFYKQSDDGYTRVGVIVLSAYGIKRGHARLAFLDPRHRMAT